MSGALWNQAVDLEVDGTALRLSTLQRDGGDAPIIFLHGFGSTKEDFADIQRHDAFEGHGVLYEHCPMARFDSGVSDSRVAALYPAFDAGYLSRRP